MKKISKFIICILLITVLIFNSIFIVIASNASDNNKYYFGYDYTFKSDTNNGYNGDAYISKDDYQYGWELGQFIISGYTDVINATEETSTVFLKTVGDKLSLSFELFQNIDKLNDDTKLSIADDNKGYDEIFNISESDFGRGMLIIQKKNSENKWEEPILYSDFLSLKAKNGETVDVELFEEGDYCISLDYKIEKKSLKFVKTHQDYSLYFEFSVRNGNCMVYPFDLKTGEELREKSFTENGFRIDLANSKYLNVTVKREIYYEGDMGLTEDVRFNKSATDGEEFTEEGIYTITVKNTATNEETNKMIYIGTDSLLKAYVTNNLSISEIQAKIDDGATINDDGKLISTDGTVINIPRQYENDNYYNADTDNSFFDYSIITICLIFIIIILLTILLVKKSRRRKKIKKAIAIKNKDLEAINREK